jgi:hypothetical protein
MTLDEVFNEFSSLIHGVTKIEGDKIEFKRNDECFFMDKTEFLEKFVKLEILERHL